MATDKTDDLLISVSTDLSVVKRQLKQLGDSVNQTTSGIQKQWAATGAAIDKSTTALQSRINDMVGIGTKGAKQWQGVLADQGKEFERLRAKINPVFATVTQYKASVVEIQTAHRLGAISADEMTAAIGRERTAALASIEAIKKRNAVIAGTPNRAGNSFNTANIAAQFQDIGVTAAMGMSPIQIALQQGTQLSSVLGQVGGTKGAIKELGAAFASIVSPVSLVTIGVVGMTAAAIEFFASFASGSDDTEAALKAQAELIQRVADKWGDALPSLKAYADEQKRLADQADVGQATAALVKDIWAPAKAEVEDTRAAVADVVSQLQLAGAHSSDIVPVQRAFEELRSKLADGSAQTEDLQRVSDALANAYRAVSIPAVSDLATEFSNLADQIAKAAQAATLAKAEAAMKDMQASLPALGTIPPVYSGGGKFQNEADVMNDRANATKSKYQLELEKASRHRGGFRAPAKTADDRFFEDIQSIRDRTAALAQEQSMLGLSFEAQTKRKVAFDLETTALKQVREEARKKGDVDWQNAQLTPDMVAKIDQVSEAYARQADALRKAQEMYDLQRDVIKGAFDDLRSALEDGKLDWQDFGKIANDVLDKIIDKIENDLVDAIMQASGAGGGSFGSILGFLTGSGGGGGSDPGIISALGLRANGGPVQAGKPYIVGEKRAELFVPNVSGTIVPRVPTMPSINGGGGGSQTFAPVVTFAPTIQMQGNGDAGEQVTAALKKFEKEFTPRVVKSLREAKTRGMV